MRKVLFSIWFLLFILSVLFLLKMNTDLPERFATHFDFYGKPNGWSTKAFFIPLFGGTILFINAVLLSVAKYIKKIPPNMLNWPNKDYWLSSPKLKEEMYNRVAIVNIAAAIFSSLVVLFCEYAIYQAAGGVVPFNFDINKGVWLIFVLAAVFVVATYRFSRNIP